MATQHRIEKINELIRTEISDEISSKLKDPRLENKVVGITRVKTTHDMKYCKVYVSIYGDQNEVAEIMSVLDKAKGFLRKCVSEALTTRYTPELTFVHYDSIDNYEHIESILKGLTYNDEL